MSADCMSKAIQSVCDETNAALKLIGVKMRVYSMPENMTGDDGMDGHVVIDDLICIYPQEVDGIRQGVGWGVCATKAVPGVHTMPNGDPGYPDEMDMIDIATPYVESKSIVGTLRFPRTQRQAIHCAIKEAVVWRLNDWLDIGGWDDGEDSTDA